MKNEKMTLMQNWKNFVSPEIEATLTNTKMWESKKYSFNYFSGLDSFWIYSENEKLKKATQAQKIGFFAVWFNFFIVSFLTTINKLYKDYNKNLPILPNGSIKKFDYFFYTQNRNNDKNFNNILDGILDLYNETFEENYTYLVEFILYNLPANNNFEYTQKNDQKAIKDLNKIIKNNFAGINKDVF